MKLLKRVTAIAITLGFLAATGCSYKTCPAYAQYTPEGPDVLAKQVASPASAE